MTVVTWSRFYLAMLLSLLLAVYPCTLRSAVARAVALWQCNRVIAERSTNSRFE
jgi:hypothetical protein